MRLLFICHILTSYAQEEISGYNVSGPFLELAPGLIQIFCKALIILQRPGMVMVEEGVANRAY